MVRVHFRLLERSGKDEYTMEKPLTILISGVVTIGIITALFYPGRQTVAGVKAGFSGANSLLKTSITGK